MMDPVFVATDYSMIIDNLTKIKLPSWLEKVRNDMKSDFEAKFELFLVLWFQSLKFKSAYFCVYTIFPGVSTFMDQDKDFKEPNPMNVLPPVGKSKSS